MNRALVIGLALMTVFGMRCASADDSPPAGIVYIWRMDATWCGPYPVDPTQTVCKEQTVGGPYDSKALCRAHVPEKQKEGYTDISCERIAIEPCNSRDPAVLNKYDCGD